MRRRRFLRRGAAAAALALAGCTGDGGGSTPTATQAPDTRSTTPTTGESTASPSAMTTATASPTDTETTSRTDTPSPTPTRTPLPSVEQEVLVGPGSLSFEPESFEIPTGATVRWVWESGGHNVKVSSQPSGADWPGTPGEEFDTFDAGHTYAYTFEVDGDYQYYCAPHRSAGMTGSFTVG